MFKPQSIVNQYTNRNALSKLPERFSILSWNIQKKNKNKRTIEHLHHFHSQYPNHIYLFQEAKRPVPEGFFIPNYESVFSANVQMKRRSYGLLTVSCCCNYLDALVLVSDNSEFLINTYKCTLINQYRLANDQILLVANVHAINFKDYRTFAHEIAEITAELANHKGPMIIAGDFNTWNIKRYQTLNMMKRVLRLKHIRFSARAHIKTFAKLPLDHMFYRDLDLLSASVHNHKQISDHNPLRATFHISRSYHDH